MKILVIFGTRPEAIKMAPVINELKKQKEFESRICVTGQHREMLDQVLNLFELVPEYDLNLMRPGQDLTDITCSILNGMREVLRTWRPDWILVHGDTTTTLAASLAGYYEKINVAHVEAGLRTHNIYSPWPEEVNRKVTTTIAKIHYAPTEKAKRNLLKEGVQECSIFVTGNTVIDSLLRVTEKIHLDEALREKLSKNFNFINFNKKIVLVTGHRRENFGDGFENICKALKVISKRDDIEIIYPVHLNPNVLMPVNRILGGCGNVHLIEPQEYLSFTYLMSKAYIILTDSGGIQEEAPSLRKPVLVMRDTSERPEAIEAGSAKLVGTKVNKIVEFANLLLDDNEYYKNMIATKNPYGNGDASKIIVKSLRDYKKIER